MRVTVNGEPRELAVNASVADLVSELGMTEIRLAVELNRSVVPRAEFDKRLLSDGDAIEIVTVVGGG